MRLMNFQCATGVPKEYFADEQSQSSVLSTTQWKQAIVYIMFVNPGNRVYNVCKCRGE